MCHGDFLKHFLESEGFLKAYLLAASGDPHAAEDLFQEVWAVLWELSDRYDPARPFRAWATGVARVQVLKWRQRLARSREVLSVETISVLADTAAEQTTEGEADREALESCLLDLEEPMREVLRLRYAESLPVARIAERIGKSVGAVEMALVRGRRALRARMDMLRIDLEKSAP